MIFELLDLTVAILLMLQIRVRMKAQMRQNGGGNDALVKATDAAWEKIIKMALGDPKGWKERIKVMFKRFDTDGSGDIDVEELGAGLSSLGIVLKRHEVYSYASDVDDDGGGTIGLEEILTAVSQRIKMDGKIAGPPLTAADREALHPDFLKKCADGKTLAWETIIDRVTSDPRGWKIPATAHFAEFDFDSTGQMSIYDFQDMLKTRTGFL